MEKVIEFLKTDNFMLGMVCFVALMFIIFLINLINTSKTRKKYQTLMKKLGNGNNIEEMLIKYVDTVDKVEKENRELKVYCEKLDKDISKCIQKVGIVRYSAFKDIGSDLSFALALLDENNNGVVMNGIYSAEASNIYSKPITNGESKYTLSEEEIKAINAAIENFGMQNIK